eukprot:CAMPEP_0172499404 /NCGR_PEP_ID=MMETSP1066-20121228/126774_1 /TAXON_ID=671091 /ORGANISM="Coscinodiscus wailesii, Strain CCMP2513" /LENGTH=111 /DNA_ID=CAMNT_0013273133 /DNA_START=94 /DNA_END=429 /DNA_ORIENTATION=+
MAKKTTAPSSSGGLKGFLTNAYASFAKGGGLIKQYGYMAAETGGKFAFIVATTSIIVFMPLIFEIVRETQGLEMERSQVKDLRSNGFTDAQLRDMGFCDASVRPPSVAMQK